MYRESDRETVRQTDKRTESERDKKRQRHLSMSEIERDTHVKGHTYRG
jgi:hypothetical protein